MTTLEAIVLGIIQGLFMFVPVSSTSHLALSQHWFAAAGSEMPPPDSPEMILFDIVVHVGTLVSIVVVMRAGLAKLLTGVGADLRQVAGRQGGRHRRRRFGVAEATPVAAAVLSPPRPDYLYLRLAALGMVTVATTGVLGLVIRAVGTGIFALPALIAVALIITGGILWWTDSAGPQWRGARQLTVWVAIGIGVAQAAALVPGFSRSGLTIAAALLFGLYRPLAAQFSFFVAIPTILAAMVVQTADVLRSPEELTIGLPAYAAGFVVAAVVGAFALALVLKLLYKAKFRYFAVYVWLLALAVLFIQPPHLG
ncbi:undecaprenyl-diphosphate phosphatase [Natronosporangium hydrolyticum]|uniref:Undecaprenyl-diphosphatase n=1 Tax=Natronosporangium hydrolyticum TaxID=2811111 RepID=A0A895Y7F6_9ACTN|nr:undecaprenyl-diphosphate phosphatase [Natronosporangium hydrolyticum]QSB13291.1 undecaprenyl-diphosphate phosphatase [Natronosporangium hydrolyticum]